LCSEGGEEVELVVEEVEARERSGGRGRKLQEPAGRWETRVKISVMRRCWTEVSCWKDVSMVRDRERGRGTSWV
jgi:hypothetical protein